MLKIVHKSCFFDQISSKFQFLVPKIFQKLKISFKVASGPLKSTAHPRDDCPPISTWGVEEKLTNFAPNGDFCSLFDQFRSKIVIFLGSKFQNLFVLGYASNGDIGGVGSPYAGSYSDDGTEADGSYPLLTFELAIKAC